MATLLIETTDIQQAMEAERQASPGLLEARLNLLSPIPQEELNTFHTYLLDSGVDVRGCLQQRIKGLWQISVKYQKHAPSEHVAQFQLLIPLIPIALISILVGIALFKIQQIIALVGVVLVGTILLALVLPKVLKSLPGR